MSAEVPLLKHLPPPLRAEVSQRLHHIRATKGRHLLEKDSTSTDVFFVLEGNAEVVLYSSNGRRVSVHTMGPGDMFGELAALDGGPRSASIVASSDIRYARMRASDFMKCLECSPEAVIGLTRVLVSSLRRATEQIFELSTLNVRARIHCELLRLARKGEPQKDGTVVVRGAPTHEALADRIGTHREAVTREMRALSDNKIIRYGRGSLTILNMARLEEEALRQ